MNIGDAGINTQNKWLYLKYIDNILVMRYNNYNVFRDHIISYIQLRIDDALKRFRYKFI